MPQQNTTFLIRHAEIARSEYKPANDLPHGPPRARSSSAPILTHPAMHQSSHNRSAMTSDQLYDQSKKGLVVNQYFRNDEFAGAPENAVDNLVRNFEICSIRQCLDKLRNSLFFIDTLEDPAGEFFLRQCSSRMLFEEIANRMRRH